MSDISIMHAYLADIKETEAEVTKENGKKFDIQASELKKYCS